MTFASATLPAPVRGLRRTRMWFWKSLRWFSSCLLIAPTAALVLGIGVKLSKGVSVGDLESPRLGMRMRGPSGDVVTHWRGRAR
jgi:hypothetical protein